MRKNRTVGLVGLIAVGAMLTMGLAGCGDQAEPKSAAGPVKIVKDDNGRPIGMESAPKATREPKPIGTAQSEDSPETMPMPKLP